VLKHCATVKEDDMRWFQKERVKGSKTNELRLGIASWDNGDGKAKSIKYTWFDKLNRAARGGEIPVDLTLLFRARA
jgi:hypothetical protein